VADTTCHLSPATTPDPEESQRRKVEELDTAVTVADTTSRRRPASSRVPVACRCQWAQSVGRAVPLASLKLPGEPVAAEVRRLMLATVPEVRVAVVDTTSHRMPTTIRVLAMYRSFSPRVPAHGGMARLYRECHEPSAISWITTNGHGAVGSMGHEVVRAPELGSGGHATVTLQISDCPHGAEKSEREEDDKFP